MPRFTWRVFEDDLFGRGRTPSCGTRGRNDRSVCGGPAFLSLAAWRPEVEPYRAALEGRRDDPDPVIRQTVAQLRR